MRQRVAMLLVLLVAPGCTHSSWVQPATVHHDGRVSGTNVGTRDPESLRLRAGQNVKLLLQPSSLLCVAESSKPVCTLEGRLLRLELSANRDVTGFVVRPTSLFVQDFLEGPGKRPVRKKLPLSAGEVRLAIGDIKAFFYKHWYVPNTVG